jgi:hypothetical protein
MEMHARASNDSILPSTNNDLSCILLQYIFEIQS